MATATATKLDLLSPANLGDMKLENRMILADYPSLVNSYLEFMS